MEEFLTIIMTMAAVGGVPYLLVCSHQRSVEKDEQRKQAEAQRALVAWRSAKDEVHQLIAPHLPTLARRRLILVKTDAYGVVDASGWIKEMDYVYENVVKPHLSDWALETIEIHGVDAIIQECIQQPAELEAETIYSDDTFSEDMSPLDYERFCASRLEEAGWACEVTKASGDQGVDVVARKGSVTLVLQCKKYSNPVGNGAVQEIIAAKAHLRATYAAVVSNAAYTRSAVELANSTSVLLLHHAELAQVDSRLPAIGVAR